MFSSLAAAGEPVVKGSFHTILILGQNCLTAPDDETYLLPGARLQMRACQKSSQQIFDWNVVTFEIKFRGLCVDAFRAGEGKTKAGDPVGLWYCNKTPHQKWYPNHSNESWLEAFNIVRRQPEQRALPEHRRRERRRRRAADHPDLRRRRPPVVPHVSVAAAAGSAGFAAEQSDVAYDDPGDRRRAKTRAAPLASPP